MRRLFVSLLVFQMVAGCAHPPLRGPVHSPLVDDPSLVIGVPVGGASGVAELPDFEGAHPLPFYVQVALDRNPELMASELRVAAQGEVIPQVTALPDPVVGDTFWPVTDNSPQTASGRMSNSLMLTQPLPWYGKLRVRGEVADLDRRIAITQLMETKLKIIEDVKFAYYEIYFSQRAIKITSGNEKLLKDYVRFAEARYKAGQTSQQDVLRAQVELTGLRDRLIALERQHKVAQADLAKLISVSPEADLRAVETLDLPAVPEQIDHLYQLAVAARPELQGRLQVIDRNRRMVDLARLNYYPDGAVWFGWGEITRDDALSMAANGRDNVGFGFAVTLPIWRDKLSAGVREAELRTAESVRRYDVTRDDTLRLIRRLTVQSDAAKKQIELYRKELIPKAEQTLRVSTADYRVGKVGMLTLVDNWEQLLRYQIQLAHLEATLGQALASLERSVGIELEAVPKQKIPAPSESE